VGSGHSETLDGNKSDSIDESAFVYDETSLRKETLTFRFSTYLNTKYARE
jgi:hypothetical protein